MADDLDEQLFRTLLTRGRLPHTSAVFKDGVDFRSFFVTNPICCPSRATYLTGQYSHNHGALAVMGPELFSFGLSYWLNEDGSPRQERNTLPVWMQKGGYVTAHFGKYLNGYGFDTKETYVPPGYDEWQALIDLSTYLMYDFRWNRNGQVHKSAPGSYQTDFLAEAASDFFQNYRSRFAAKPFFAAIMPVAPHVEHRMWHDVLSFVTRPFFPFIRPAPRHQHLIDGEVANDEIVYHPPTAFNPAKMPGKGRYIQRHRILDRFDRRDVLRQWKSRAASMLAFDDLIGDVVHSLKEQGLFENTVFLFTSDNGWFHGEHRLTQKALPYEQAIRVPLLVAGPGIPRGENFDLIANHDLAPTIADLTDIVPGLDVDGRSFAALLTGSRPNWTRKSVLLEGFCVRSFAFSINRPTFAGIRERSHGNDRVFFQWLDGWVDKGDLETLSVEARETEFYDLRTDPHQQRPLMVPNAKVEPFLEHLRDCRAESCRHWEDQGMPLAQTTFPPATGVIAQRWDRPLKFFHYLYAEKTWIFIWVSWLIVINSLSLLFWRQREARAILMAWSVNIILMMSLFAANGWNRLLGLPHIVCWTPLLIWLRPQISLQRPVSGSRIYVRWFWAAIVSIGVSLIFDTIDVIRYFGGAK